MIDKNSFELMRRQFEQFDALREQAGRVVFVNHRRGAAVFAFANFHHRDAAAAHGDHDDASVQNGFDGG